MRQGSNGSCFFQSSFDIISRLQFDVCCSVKASAGIRHHHVRRVKTVIRGCLSQEVVHKQLHKAELLPAPFFIHAYAHKCAASSSRLPGNASSLTVTSIAKSCHIVQPGHGAV